MSTTSITSAIRFRYTPHAGDYIQGMWAQLRRRPITRVWLAITAPASLCLLTSIPIMLVQGAPALTPAYLLPLFVASLPLAVPWMVFYVVLPLRLRRQVARNERLRCETFGLADDRGLLLRHRYGEVKLDWDVFATFVETRKHFMLPRTADELLYQVIPKRGFESAQAVAAFRELLRRKLIDYQAGARRRPAGAG